MAKEITIRNGETGVLLSVLSDRVRLQLGRKHIHFTVAKSIPIIPETGAPLCLDDLVRAWYEKGEKQ